MPSHFLEVLLVIVVAAAVLIDACLSLSTGTGNIRRSIVTCIARIVTKAGFCKGDHVVLLGKLVTSV